MMTMITVMTKTAMMITDNDCNNNYTTIKMMKRMTVKITTIFRNTSTMFYFRGKFTL